MLPTSRGIHNLDDTVAQVVIADGQNDDLQGIVITLVKEDRDDSN